MNRKAPIDEQYGAIIEVESAFGNIIGYHLDACRLNREHRLVSPNRSDKKFVYKVRFRRSAETFIDDF